MSETKHTPGPWEWRNFGGEWYELHAGHSGRPVVLGTHIVNYRGDWDAPHDVVLGTKDVAPGVGMRPIRPDDPDARLIAAAPDLLSACEKAIVHLDLANDDPTGKTYALYVSLRDAIAKANGT
jgi:hypothetical protein